MAAEWAWAFRNIRESSFVATERMLLRSGLQRVLFNDPATGVMRHADAGYDIAIECAHAKHLDLPML